MNTTNKTPQFYGFHFGDELMCEIRDLETKNKELWEKLREKNFRASDLGINRRVLSHWRSTGIMDIHDDNPEQTRLSFAGLFWLQIVNDLRKFGLSLDKIGNIKKQLFDDSNVPLIEVYMFFTVTRKNLDVFMLVSPDGRVVIGTRNEIDLSESFGLLEENYIKINFNIIRNRILKTKVNIVQQSLPQFSLSDTEISILDLIRDGEYKEITLKFNSGAITTVSKKSFEQNPDPIKELKKMIASNDDFCELSIKKINGKVVCLEKIVMARP